MTSGQYLCLSWCYNSGSSSRSRGGGFKVLKLACSVGSKIVVDVDSGGWLVMMMAQAVVIPT